GSADLRVRAFDGAGTEIAVSPVVFNAPTKAEIELVIAANGTGPSEYERVQQALAALTQGKIELVDLPQAAVAFAALETGFGDEPIVLFVLAHRHALGTKIDPAIFYGLMRKGLPAELPALLALGPEVHRSTLKRAVATNIIPASVLDQLDAIVA